MTDNEIFKAIECCADGDCRDCPYYGTHCENYEENVLSLVNRQKAEIERLELVAEINKRDHQRKMHESGNAVDVLYELYDEGIKKIERLEGELKTAQAEAIKAFAEGLCADRVSNDPVVIAVKTELKMAGYDKVTRCADCQHCALDYADQGFGYPSKPTRVCIIHDHETTLDDYCSWARRKDGADNE